MLPKKRKNKRKGNVVEKRILVRNVLEKAEKSLSSKTWIQGSMARDASGQNVLPDSLKARYWSASGSIRRFADPRTSILAIVSVEVTLGQALDVWNNKPGKTVCDVRKVFRKTRKRLDALIVGTTR